jgi:hypothetical protein
VLGPAARPAGGEVLAARAVGVAAAAAPAAPAAGAIRMPAGAARRPAPRAILRNVLLRPPAAVMTGLPFLSA